MVDPSYIPNIVNNIANVVDFELFLFVYRARWILIRRIISFQATVYFIAVCGKLSHLEPYQYDCKVYSMS